MSQDFIDRMAAAAAEAPSIRALFLGGSRARGEEDRWSDYDFIGLATDRQEAASLWRAALERIEPVVFWAEHRRGGLLINAVTQGWARFDLHLIDEEALARHAQDRTRPVFDPEGLHARMRPEAPPARMSPERLTALIEEFLRVLGLVPLVLGRGEHAVALWGVQLQRNHLSELMLEERGAGGRGALRVEALLDDGQRAELRGLPVAGMDRASLIAVHLALADAFLPRARTLAAARGARWPDAFEAAMWAHLGRELGIDAADRPARRSV